MIYYIASYPRSGNSWTRNLITNQFGRLTSSMYGKPDPADVIEWILSGSNKSFSYRYFYLTPDQEELDPDLIYYHPIEDDSVIYRTLPLGCKKYLRSDDHRRKIAALDEIIFVKTHEMPFRTYYPGEYVIQPVRNPGACFWSFYHYSHDLQGNDFSLTDIIKGRLNWKSWNDYHKAWRDIEKALDDHYLSFHYEDMFDELAICKQLEAFTGLSLLNTSFRPFEYYHQANPKLARQGKATGWEEHFSEKQLALLWEKHGEMMAYHGYANPAIERENSSFLNPVPEIASTAPIFITERLGSGSTLVWNLFHPLPKTTVIHQPLYEKLQSYISQTPFSLEQEERIDPEFEIYRWLYEPMALHDSAFGLSRLLLEADELFEPLKEYLSSLINTTPKQQTPVLHFKRIDFRLPWIKHNFPQAKILHLYRSPRTQWHSMLENFQGDPDTNMSIDPAGIMTWTRDLLKIFPFLANPQIEHPYQRFYYLWKLSTLAGSRLADLSVAYEDLLRDPEIIVPEILALAGMGTDENRSNAIRSVMAEPVTEVVQEKPDEWFARLERACDDVLTTLGLMENFGLQSLPEIIAASADYQKMLNDTNTLAWAVTHANHVILRQKKQLDKQALALKRQRKSLLYRAQQIELLQGSVRSYIQKFLPYLEYSTERLNQIAESALQPGFPQAANELIEKERVIQELLRYRNTSLRYWLIEKVGRKLYRLPGVARTYKILRDFRRKLLPKLFVLEQHPPHPIRLPGKYTRIAKLENTDAVPMISIVTPSFNQGKFLERTIKSVIDQQYPRLEYILQDGGSSDDSPQIIEKYRPYFTEAVSQPDQGQADAINQGFQKSHGEIMAYLNSDDILLPGALASVANYFASHPEVDVIYSNRVIIDENDLMVGKWILPPHDPIALFYADYVPQETLFWRRTIWEKAGETLNEKYNFALDWDMLLRFQEAGAVFTRITRPLAAFRIHNAQKTTASMASVGEKEMRRIRNHFMGHAVTAEEIDQNLRPYRKKANRHRILFMLGYGKN